MKDTQEVTEAYNLKKRLFSAWDNTPHDTLYAARLVAAAERAHQRHIRRAARSGDPLAQNWLIVIHKAIQA